MNQLRMSTNQMPWEGNQNVLCKTKNKNNDVHLTSEIFYRTLDVSIEDDQMFNVFKDNIKYYPLNTEFTPKHITWKGYTDFPCPYHPYALRECLWHFSNISLSHLFYQRYG
jgi:hypothetical protein